MTGRAQRSTIALQRAISAALPVAKPAAGRSLPKTRSGVRRALPPGQGAARPAVGVESPRTLRRAGAPVRRRRCSARVAAGTSYGAASGRREKFGTPRSAGRSAVGRRRSTARPLGLGRGSGARLGRQRVRGGPAKGWSAALRRSHRPIGVGPTLAPSVEPVPGDDRLPGICRVVTVRSIRSIPRGMRPLCEYPGGSRRRSVNACRSPSPSKMGQDGAVVAQAGSHVANARPS